MNRLLGIAGRKIFIRNAPQGILQLNCRSISSSSVQSHQNVEIRKEKSQQVAAPLKKVSFINKLFIGELDTEVLEYPECLDDDQLADILSLKDKCQLVYDNTVRSHDIDLNKRVDPETLIELRNNGYFGLKIPRIFKGLGLTSTETAQIAEILGLDFSLGCTLLFHNDIVVKAVLNHGTEKQKEKYLQKLVEESCATLAVYEENDFMDMTNISTKAEVVDLDKFALNGEKTFVSKIDSLNKTYFLVTAEMMPKPLIDHPHSAIGLFLVSSDQPGIEFKPINTLGMRGMSFGTLTLTNCIVGKEDMLGHPKDGYDTMITLLNESRLLYAAHLLGVMKNIFTYTLQYTQKKNVFGNRMSELQFVKEKMAVMASKIYAVESYVYLCLGDEDLDKRADSHLNANLAKVVASDTAFYVIKECAMIMEGYGIDEKYPLSRCYRDVLTSSIINGNNDALESYIAINGLAYAGSIKEEAVRKLRNKVYHPSYIFKKALEDRKIVKFKRKRVQKLREYIHPSHTPVIDSFEDTLLAFDEVAEFCLVRYGAKIVEEGILLKLMGKIACRFALTAACLSRSSRAYCTGLRHADLEMELTMLYANESESIIRKSIDHVMTAKYQGSDLAKLKAAILLYDNKGYCLETPIKRNI